MIDPSRHVPLRSTPWSPVDASAAIEEIVADALAHFDAERLWPSHPREDGLPDGMANLWVGAAGVIWGLDYLARSGVTHPRLDFGPVLPRLLEVGAAELSTRGDYAAHGAFLLGDLGTALVAMRIGGSAEIADLVYERCARNAALPIRELMWGLSGSMLACIHMHAMTHEPLWRHLFSAQAARLLDDLEETVLGPLWNVDLYGNVQPWLGPVHGYAGNMIPLLRGWEWLTASQRATVAGAVPRTLAATAYRSELGATWRPVATRTNPPALCQHCHGAPGMVTTFADTPFASPELDALLVEGGTFTWSAGPLAKGSNLCHGTGGNGYAFLKLHGRTGDSIWLERARAFAMTAIAQCREARAELGRGRFSLWTGDVGLAIYLWDCITGEPHFPTVDVF
ncbi:MAG TPA: LanC-like protein [Burkholderiales bacterium]|nr:LanC-like protein [Burkholderiales bacterium]